MIEAPGVEHLAKIRLQRERRFRRLARFLAQGRSFFQSTAHVTAGIDPAQDRKRFVVTDRGVTLITPELLGNAMHHLR